MRKLPPRRLNPLAVVAAIAAAQATFEQQLREANLKMPIKDKMRELAKQMQGHLDAELKKAVERFLGFEVTDPQQVAGRLQHVHLEGEVGTIYAVDGVAVLRAGPQVLDRREDAIHAFQLVEQLLPEDYKPAAKGGIILPC